MDTTPPRVYLLTGDDELAISEFIAHLRDRLGDPTIADMNTQAFAGEGLDLGTLHEACAAMPFLARRRLIILQRPSAYYRSDSRRFEQFASLLESIPLSTALVLVEPGEGRRRRGHDESRVEAWVRSHPELAFRRDCIIPHGEDFLRWIRQRCQSLGGEIEPEAARRLAELVADDPRLADQELTKLLDYVDRQRPVQAEDVQRLTPFTGQTDVFAMVDALGTGDARQAQAHLHRLLEHESPRYAFAMIARQFRLLLLAREALDQGKDPAEALAVHAFVARKIAAQAQGFTMPDLEGVYHRLLETDLAIKTSQVEDTVALHTLVAGLAHRI
jgi:DNA polymerase-3 subunit delta